MSFRTRLTLFFLLIVVVPMIALGVVVSRLISDSEAGKANARAGAFAAVAVDDYRAHFADGARVARSLAGDRALVAALRRRDAAAARARAAILAGTRHLSRVRIAIGTRTLVDVGDRRALAAGSATIRDLARIEASTISASRFVATTSKPGVRTVVERGGAVLAASVPSAARRTLPAGGTVALHGNHYTVATFRAADFAGSTDTISILANTNDAASTATRWLALGLLGAFLMLAFLGSLVISKQLQSQLARFLLAARRIGAGDFSATVPADGNDEFAALGREFNKMSDQLERRLTQLRRERRRLRESIQRIGDTFASNLDRSALLEIGTRTAVDAVAAGCGRAKVRATDSTDLVECARVGELDGAHDAIAAAEAQALERGTAVATTIEDVSALAAPIACEDERRAVHGVISVARRGERFDDEEHELVAFLARQTGISLENIGLHDQVKRQAVTDELTGLFNHRRFQEVVTTEVAASERFGQPLGLLMLDIDDFKAVNDTYGHQQGDLVLREVARILRESSREIDEPARYGGEEMAVALPQTDLDGAFVIAERVRTAVEALAIPCLTGEGVLKVTISCGVAASTSGDKHALIAAADAALYEAKRMGKNRTVKAAALLPPLVRAEDRADQII